MARVLRVPHLRPGVRQDHEHAQEEATRYNLYEAIRETYDGPLSMAADNMVRNITPEGVTERMAVITEDAWSVPGAARQAPPERSRRPVFSEFTDTGYLLPAYEAQDEAMDECMKEHGLENEDWRPGLKKQIRDAEEN